MYSVQADLGSLAECSILWAWASVRRSQKETDVKIDSFSPVESLWF